MICKTCEYAIIITYEGGPFTESGGYTEYYKYFCLVMNYREMAEKVLGCNRCEVKE